MGSVRLKYGLTVERALCRLVFPVKGHTADKNISADSFMPPCYIPATETTYRFLLLMGAFDPDAGNELETGKFNGGIAWIEAASDEVGMLVPSVP